jgi:hypothetical protein
MGRLLGVVVVIGAVAAFREWRIRSLEAQLDPDRSG